MDKQEPYICLEEDAATIAQWLRERGGIAVWESLDLSTPGRSWTTPLCQADGTPTPRPHWSVGAEPSRVIRSMDDVLVSRTLEHIRFRIAIERGSGLKLELTAASSRRVRQELKNAGEGSWYRFDGSECVIMRLPVVISLRRWWNANSYVTLDFLRAGTIGR